jgi:hypothetical protein
MASTLGRGLLAGAVGTTLLNAAGYLDMALTDRAASSAPAETTSRALSRIGITPSKAGNRREAVGAVGGIATGLGIGVVAALARRVGVRLPAPVGATAIGALAMAATDAPMAGLGVSDPRTWTAADWTRDIVPHLAYGLGVHWALERTDPHTVRGLTAVPPLVSGEAEDSSRPSAGRALTKSLVMGLAAGGRSSLGFGAPLLTALRPRTRLLGGSLIVGELVADKLPFIPSRLESGPLLGRATAGGVGGAVVTARHGHAALAVVGAALGIAGAVAGSVLGVAWREVAQNQGYTWQAALVEDAASLALGAYALS